MKMNENGGIANDGYITRPDTMAVSGIMAVDAAVGEKFCFMLLFWATSFNTLRLKPNR